MRIDYEQRTNKFVITCGYGESAIVTGMPDRSYRKATRTWGAPCLSRNLQYMKQHMNNPSMFTDKALEAYNNGLKALSQNINIDTQFPIDTHPFKMPPMNHQIEAFNKFHNQDEIALLFEQGMGKTYTSINLAYHWYLTGKINAVLVVCPSAIKLVWNLELDKHLPCKPNKHVLTAGKYRAAEQFIEDPTDDLKWMIMGVEGLSQGNGFDYAKWFMLHRKVLIIVDESSRIKTPSKNRTDRTITLGKNAKKRIILSGTSITNGIEDWYTQFKFLNPNILGFNSFYTFRDYFCITQSIEVSEGRFVSKIVGHQHEDELVKAVAPHTLRVEKKDAMDLPDKIFLNRYITMNPAQKKMYKTMDEALMVEYSGGEYSTDTSLERMLRLQQITGGFHPHDDGVRIQVKPIAGKNPKVEETMALLDEIAGKVVIWCQFRAEIDAIAEQLTDVGINFVQFHGGCDDTQKAFAVKAFQDDPTVKVFLATRAGAYGLTLTSANYAIYYSQGYSLEEYSQSQDRIHRIGQHDKCTYIHLLCEDTVDVDVMKALQEKQDVATYVYDTVKTST